MRPYYPASGLYRIVRDRHGMQLDFMSKVDGIRSFEWLRARASRVEFGGAEILVADLRDVIRSKEAADRRSMSAKRRSRAGRRASALRREADRVLVEQIRRQLALQPERRTNFLRVRRSGKGSAV